MNFTQDFYTELEAARGDSQKVAAKITEQLNAAIKQYDNKFQKKEDADKLAEQFNKFEEKYYPNINNMNNEKLTGEFIIKIFDGTENFIISNSDIKKVTKELKKKTKTLSDMIAEMGW